nr:nucleotide-binding alpha-beta plait domain-containing protein [Tanacetum cinerariifolium]
FWAKDLWNTRKQYGHVVDAYIPNRRPKAGKRFVFVHFIKVHREPLNKHSNIHYDNGVKRGNLGVVHNDKGAKDASNSYAYFVKGSQNLKVNTDLNPALVLDDSFLNQKDYSLCLMGKVKDFASLSKLKVVLINEGFSNTKLRYMGGYWVMIEFQLVEIMKSFQANMGIGTWFSHIQQVSHDFIIDERVTWVEIEGIPLKTWSENTFNRVASKWVVLLDVDEKEDGCLHSKRICINTTVSTNIFESFKVIYRGMVVWVKAKVVPGWVPDFVEDNEEENESDDESYEDEPNVGDFKNVKDLEGDSDGDAVPDTKFNEEPHIQNDAEVSVGQNNVQSEDPFNLYELLNKKRDGTTKDLNST